MTTQNVVLADHRTFLVEQIVNTGKYQNAREVLREWLRLIEEGETEQAARLDALSVEPTA